MHTFFLLTSVLSLVLHPVRPAFAQPPAEGPPAADADEAEADEPGDEREGSFWSEGAETSAEAEGDAAADRPDPAERDDDDGASPEDERTDDGEAGAGEDAPDLDEQAEDDLVLHGTGNGEYQLRVNAMHDIPLQPLPRDPTGSTGSLGQQYWSEQWIRMRVDAGLPALRIKGEIDLFDGVLVGDFARGVSAAERPRDDATAFPGVQPRALYLESLNPAGLFRIGLMTSHWGLGILANDGDHEPPFGDYRYGDVVTRVAWASQPFGEDVPFFTALAGDLVFDDLIADVRDDDIALQAVLALSWREDEEHTVGMYGVYRSQRGEIDEGPVPQQDALDVFVLDLYARWDVDEPGGGKLFGAVEGAWIEGTTTQARTRDRTEHDVRQFLVAAQVGRAADRLEVVMEVGWTSGDSNTEDAVQRRGVMDPDHRVGLIMFPEVVAWHTARSATISQSEELTGRPSPGSDRIPTNGSVAGAAYLFPYGIWRPTSWMDLRLGAVWGIATADIVDPYTQRAYSRSQGFRGADPQNRDLGFELDAAWRLKTELADGIDLMGGLEGGVFFPGHAFDDADGVGMDTIALLRVRAGLSF